MTKKDFDVISFGEIMLRLSPPSNERIVRGEVFHKCAGGSELNVASGVSLLGLRTGIISKLPDNELGPYIKNHVRFQGVSDDYLVYDTSPTARLGVYYYESGASPRKPAIIYDRRYSSINTISIDEIPDSVYTSTRVFHTSGITLASTSVVWTIWADPSYSTALYTTTTDQDTKAETRTIDEAAMEMIKRFKAGGAQISFDVNYRANLWSEEEAYNTITSILPYVDILFISEETSRRMFRKTGDLRDIMKSYCTEYGVDYVATTQRTVISPKQHTFGSILYCSKDDAFFTEPPYENIDVVDRIGSGDAYVAGVLFGLLQYGDPQRALEFGDATSSVKNTIPGDLPSSDFDEVTSIIRSHHSTGPQSELNR